MGTLIFIIMLVLIGWFIFQKIKANKNKPDLSALPRKFVVFDLETTGLKPESHEIIEIGALRVDLDHRDSNIESLNTDTFSALVKSKKLIPKKITEITGITQADLDSLGRPMAEVMPEFLDFIGDLPLVAFNADFDISFLENAVDREFPGRKLKNKVSCALKMARKAWPGQENYRLSALSSKMGLNTDDSHRALGDARRALVVYVHAATKLKKSAH